MNFTINGIEYRLSIHDNNSTGFVYDNTGELVGTVHINDNTESAYGETEDDNSIPVSYYEFAEVEDRVMAMATWLAGTL